MPRYEFTQAEVETRFEILARLLQTTQLPTEAGPYRQADAGEFMLMHETEDGLHFKHRDTRNYLTVTRGQGEMKIVIPTGYAFARGTFDAVVFEEALRTTDMSFQVRPTPRCGTDAPLWSNRGESTTRAGTPERRRPRSAG